MDLPIIRLEVEQMKHTMLIALSQYTDDLNEILQQSVDDYCTSENLQRIIADETKRTLDSVIKTEVQRWFTHGEGREVIKQAVEQKLKSNDTWTPLDDLK